jgi:hypothetical protein
MAALDIHKCGMIRIKQFLAGACDKRSKGVCSLLDKPSVQQRVVDGALSMTAFAELLDEEGMSMSISALAELISAQSIPIVGSAVCFADLEVNNLSLREAVSACASVLVINQSGHGRWQNWQAILPVPL